MPKPDPPVTPQSIEAAKQAAAAERDEIFRTTGVRVNDDGQIDICAVRPVGVRCGGECSGWPR